MRASEARALVAAKESMKRELTESQSSLASVGFYAPASDPSALEMLGIDSARLANSKYKKLHLLVFSRFYDAMNSSLLPKPEASYLGEFIRGENDSNSAA